MITYSDIINTFTLELSRHFKEDIYTENLEQGFKESCFFIQTFNISNNIATSKTDLKKIMVEVKYVSKKGTSKIEIYDVLDRLNKIFSRGIRVKDRYITFDSSTEGIFKDEVSYWCNKLITMSYCDYVVEEAVSDAMQDININKKG